MKAALAELIGTFTLVFIGDGTGALADPTQSGVGFIGVAFGPALAAGDLSYFFLDVRRGPAWRRSCRGLAI